MYSSGIRIMRSLNVDFTGILKLFVSILDGRTGAGFRVFW